MSKEDYRCPRCTDMMDLMGVYNVTGFLYICKKCGYKFSKMTYKPYE